MNPQGSSTATTHTHIHARGTSQMRALHPTQSSPHPREGAFIRSTPNQPSGPPRGTDHTPHIPPTHGVHPPQRLHALPHQPPWTLKPDAASSEDESSTPYPVHLRWGGDGPYPPHHLAHHEPRECPGMLLHHEPCRTTSEGQDNPLSTPSTCRTHLRRTPLHTSQTTSCTRGAYHSQNRDPSNTTSP